MSDLSFTGTGQLVRHHDPTRCEGRPCPFHHPSGHPMVTWPLLLRADRATLMERICEHGVGHPDPDSAAYWAERIPKGGWFRHGCDGCCHPPADGGGS